MTIDRDLYKKISGRSGDPMDAYGESLAKSSKKGSDRNCADYYKESLGVSYIKWRYHLSSIVSVLILGAVAWGLFFR